MKVLCGVSLFSGLSASVQKRVWEPADAPTICRMIEALDAGPDKIPPIGWDRILPVEGSDRRGSLLAGVEPGEKVYFVHSFTAQPKRARDRLANTEYNGLSLTAALHHENLFGPQFHPEKSGKTGLTILQHFINLR